MSLRTAVFITASPDGHARLDEHMTHDHTAAVVAALRDPLVTASMEPWCIPEETVAAER